MVLEWGWEKVYTYLSFDWTSTLRTACEFFLKGSCFWQSTHFSLYRFSLKAFNRGLLIFLPTQTYKLNAVTKVEVKLVKNMRHSSDQDGNI